MATRINLFGTMELYLDSSRLSCEKKLDPMPSASGSYSNLAEKTWLDFKSL